MAIGVIRDPQSMQDVLDAVANGTVEEISGDLTLEPGGGLVPLAQPQPVNTDPIPKPELKDEYKEVTLKLGKPEFKEFRTLLTDKYKDEIAAVTPYGKQVFPGEIVLIKIKQEVVDHQETEEEIQQREEQLEQYGDSPEMQDFINSIARSQLESTWDIKKTPLKFRMQWLIENQGLVKETIECANE